MATSVTLPALGESVTEGTVTRWLKQEGDQVQADEPLLEVSTDKVDTEIPAPASGTLLSIKVHEDETVEVGAELAVIGDAGGDDSSEQPAEPEPEQPAASEPEQPPASEPEPEPEQPVAQPQSEQPAGSEEPAPTAEPEQQAAPQASSGDAGGSDGGGSGGPSTSVTLPALGESVTEGTVTRWLKQEGDEVQADEPLLEVSTDKVDTEIPAPVSGTLLSIKVHEDETAEVGAELAVIGAAGGGGGGETAPAAEPEPEPAAQPEPEPAAQSEPAAQPEPQRPAAQQAPESAPATERAAQSAPASSGDGASSAYVTPLVRKLAAEKGVDLGALQGTGIGGRVRKQDVLAAAPSAQSQPAQSQPAQSQPAAKPAEAAPASAPPAAESKPAESKPAEAKPAEAAEAKPAESAPASKPAAAPAAPAASPLRGRTEKMTRLRSLIARRMVESLQVSAQLTTVVEVDVTNVARLRQRAKADFEAREGVKLSFLPFFAKAACEALKAYPQLNASIDSEANEVTYHDAEHLGVAVDTERGLLVATVHDASDLSIAGLARKIADVAGRTRDNKMSPDELTGSTFTLTNTGSRGALFDTPIIFQPQVAILGTGAVVKRPVVVDDPGLGETIAVRSMVYLALTYDHRLVDGADAARFLTMVRARLEEGKFETELGL